MVKTQTKLELRGERVEVSSARAVDMISSIFEGLGCDGDVATFSAEHLVDASLCGVESHGVMRILQYAEQFRSGYMKPDGRAHFLNNENGAPVVDGGGGIGIPAMRLAYQQGMEQASETGLSALGVINVGHTGRHGAFAEVAADQGFFTILLGGGNRKNWRQVAPYGGARALLPTNPYCLGMPGGAQGSVVVDFATSMIAGGWIYAAKSAGALLPEGCVIDRHGNPTREPEDYFNGGAILPSGGHKGYGLSLLAELVAEAMLGPVGTEANWLLITMKANQFNSASSMKTAAEELLDEMRNCPPAPGFSKVEVPGERERKLREDAKGILAVPQATWDQIEALAVELET